LEFKIPLIVQRQETTSRSSNDGSRVKFRRRLDCMPCRKPV
jgi:hypothetical protein